VERPRSELQDDRTTTMGSNLKRLKNWYDSSVEIVWNRALLKRLGTGLEVINLAARSYRHGYIEKIALESFLSILQNNSQSLQTLLLSKVKFKSQDSSSPNFDNFFPQFKIIDLNEVQDAEVLIKLLSQVSTPSFTALRLSAPLYRSDDPHQVLSLGTLCKFLQSTRTTIASIYVHHFRIDMSAPSPPQDLPIKFSALEMLSVRDCSKDLSQVSVSWTSPRIEDWTFKDNKTEIKLSSDQYLSYLTAPSLKVVSLHKIEIEEP